MKAMVKTMGKLRIAIIGCGGIANAKHMPSLKATNMADMVAFCDLIEEKAVEARNKFGAEGAKVYTDYTELLKDETIDVVHVCTPNRRHSEISVAALNAGKHVMCEKPMAINAAEAKKMVDAAKKSGKKLTIGYQSRQNPQYKYLKMMCDNDELGEIYFAKAHALRRRAVPTWGVFMNEHEQGGGPLIDIGTHSLDLTLWFMNNYKPKYCIGTTYHKLNNQTQTANAFGEWDPKEFTVEDSAFGMVVMENGATIQIESSWALNIRKPGEAMCTLAGTKAGIDMWDGLIINGVEKGRMYTKKPDFASGGVAFFEGDSGDSQDISEQRQWMLAIMNNTDPTVLPEQAYVVSQILDGIYTSAKTGQPFFFNN